MREQRLLERISYASDRAESAGAYSWVQVDMLVNSIVEHLKRILNTRQGSVPIDDDFGVPDFTNLAGTLETGDTRQIVDNVERMIKKYEPRLKSAHIAIIENDREVLSLNFSLHGLIEIDNQDIPVRLTTRISSNGQIYLARS